MNRRGLTSSCEQCAISILESPHFAVQDLIRLKLPSLGFGDRTKQSVGRWSKLLCLRRADNINAFIEQGNVDYRDFVHPLSLAGDRNGDPHP